MTSAMLLRLVLTNMALAVCGLLLVSANKDCESMENLKVIQTSCRKENEEIVLADGSGDNVTICGHFHAVMRCAVSALPHCYDYVEILYSTYYHSPYFCQLTQQLIIELQEIIMKSIQGDKSSPATEGPPGTSTTQAGQGQSSYTHSSTDQGSQVTEESTDSATRNYENGAHKGNEKNGAVEAVPRRITWSVLASAMLLWSFSS